MLAEYSAYINLAFLDIFFSCDNSNIQLQKKILALFQSSPEKTTLTLIMCRMLAVRELIDI